MITRLVLLLFLHGTMAVSMCAQSFRLAGHTLDGGGAGSGGAYALSGTMGQPDVGELVGGNHTLTGGFWSALPPEGLPSLGLELRAGVLVLTWPASATGVQVQSATQLGCRRRQLGESSGHADPDWRSF